MKKILSILLSIIFVIALACCSDNSLSNIPPSESPVGITDSFSTPSEADTTEETPQLDTQEQPNADDTIPTINIQVGDNNFTAILYDNESTRTIVEAMPFTLKMDDFASQEKVADLPFALSSAQTKTPATIDAGDIYLWSGNNLVLFYSTFSNSYSYIPVGYITDVTGLTDALGSGSVEVIFSINN